MYAWNMETDRRMDAALQPFVKVSKSRKFCCSQEKFQKQLARIGHQDYIHQAKWSYINQYSLPYDMPYVELWTGSNVVEVCSSKKLPFYT